SPDVTTRNNAQGLNINRDAFHLNTPEMIALMSMVSDVRPEIYVDFHERSGTEKRVEFIDPSKLDPNADPLIKSNAAEMELFTRSNLESIGYITSTYPQSAIGAGMTVAASALLGSVTMTPETHISINDDAYRVTALGEVFENIL